jgi:mRNA interferase MazF
MIQGDIRYYAFKVPDKRRPALILTNNDLIPILNAITVAPITTTLRDANTHIFLDESDGLNEECAVNLSAIQTIPKDKIGSYITHLPENKMKEVFATIKFVFKMK